MGIGAEDSNQKRSSFVGSEHSEQRDGESERAPAAAASGSLARIETVRANTAILFHGVSLSLRGFGRLDSRLDTPPISDRHHSVSRLAPSILPRSLPMHPPWWSKCRIGLRVMMPSVTLINGQPPSQAP